ncbi:MAG TPA: alpha-glucan family phosphorylase [Actinomycetota bacterium]|nr:alpha-glucan family phosphorylase [Actinomycetota bacterium]
MRAIRSFPVRAALPSSLEPLFEIAMNLRWTWDGRTIDLFRRLDPGAWERSHHDAVATLGMVSKRRAEAAATDDEFIAEMSAVADDLARYMTEPRWYQQHMTTSSLRTVAYFSPEFGVSETMPIYSGGLGILAGDHLKASSDLGVPLVGVGLFYRESFRQQLDAYGWQQERYPANDPYSMPLRLLSGEDGSPLQVSVDLAGAPCAAQLWSAQVGRVSLVLMDCDVAANDPAQRAVTNRLYFGDSEHRLRQEIMLGIGGVRALDAAGYDPNVFHSNEGHAGFLGLERIRRLVIREGLTFAEALEAVRATTIFTTHTPVPAGIDIYSAELMARHFSAFADECNIALEELLELGRVQPPDPEESDFNMAVMGFRLAGRANGVSKLHGDVSRTIFSSLWPGVPVNEVPIGSVTNGVHAPTWLGREMTAVLDSRLPAGWAESGERAWEQIGRVPDEELWEQRNRARERLVSFVRQRLRTQLMARGASANETAWTQTAFDPHALTFGFARRFAQYKRGTLLLTDQDRLRRMLASTDRPIQFVFSGKAHAADDGGKEMIRQLVHFSTEPGIRERFVFLEDYDMEVAQKLCRGVDVWLNNPRRPLEASGTSGMKAALNGVINCSILDGWWDECFAPEIGWAIGSTAPHGDLEHQDHVEAEALYDLLEREVIPCFYERDGSIPARWLAKVKASVSTLGPFVTADRMLRDYIEDLYEPAAEQGRDMSADGWARTRSLASWKSNVRDGWDDVAVLDIGGDLAPGDVGEERTVMATVRLGSLAEADVSVQLAHGSVGPQGELEETHMIEMQPQAYDNGTCRYHGSFVAASPGLYGFTVRVLPRHPDLIGQQDLGLVEWSPG